MVGSDADTHGPTFHGLSRAQPAMHAKQWPALWPSIHFHYSVVGKYSLGRILGVPAVVLVGIYLVTHML